MKNNERTALGSYGLAFCLCHRIRCRHSARHAARSPQNDWSWEKCMNLASCGLRAIAFIFFSVRVRNLNRRLVSAGGLNVSEQKIKLPYCRWARVHIVNINVPFKLNIYSRRFIRRTFISLIYWICDDADCFYYAYYSWFLWFHTDSRNS